MRSGYQLIEVMVALTLAAGPVAVSLQLIHSNVSGARFNAERASARLALVDLTELLIGETTAKIRAVSQPGSNTRLIELVKQRVSCLPESIRKQYGLQVASFSEGVSCTLEESVDGRKDLALLTVQARFASGSVVTVKRLFRPGARLAGANGSVAD
jgi:hypothetical protein